MQNGSVTKEVNLRWSGQFDLATQRLILRNVQASEVRSVDHWTDYPQAD
jgi:hypothetical protein